MDAALPAKASVAPRSANEPPPEAITLAGRFFDAARNGQMDIFEQALPRGLPPNLTNDKGDTLHGTDPNRLNDRGQSPLAGVVFTNEPEVIKTVLEAGADTEVGRPSAIEATKVFKQEEYEGMFREQIEKLKAEGARAIIGADYGRFVICVSPAIKIVGWFIRSYKTQKSPIRSFCFGPRHNPKKESKL
ncbi:uncharacterized protein Z518_10630 [Rhinocladiella mackenziei CBS 650.93]|uniref:Ankyrin repeat protein n=1 Tax=Rhinocladiella mackenziei CBS 650.93 TaxID=1442369 RepID=A0A0D2IUV9_9EURO|nr:uncharacterized protein Z518_10630 [Rhinocladiella mackenziei CBS 650.93]KIX00490.1 hypothetical protein Z518_10630 [Rhinocladiella mackenziei CBS 650.93]